MPANTYRGPAGPRRPLSLKEAPIEMVTSRTSIQFFIFSKRGSCAAAGSEWLRQDLPVGRPGKIQSVKFGLKAKKNPEASFSFGVWNKCLAVTYSHTANAALPSALARFTSEFGMESGGSAPLLPPGKANRESVQKRLSYQRWRM